MQIHIINTETFSLANVSNFEMEPCRCRDTLLVKRDFLRWMSQILKYCKMDVLSSLAPYIFENSFREASLYLGGFCSDRISLMGPYTRGFSFMTLLKKHGTDIRGSAAPFAITLCSTLMNLSLLISCTMKENQVTFPSFS